MQKVLSIFLILFLTSSCVTNYYFVNIEQDTPIYNSNNNGSVSKITIPKGCSAYVSLSKGKVKKIKWKDYKGWTRNPVYSLVTNSNATKPQSFTSSYSSKPSSDKTVKVKGYYRKNGTYVRPHSRSAPKRK